MGLNKHHLLKVLIVALLTICLGSTVSGQRFPFHNLNVDDGLIQSQATCMLQDKMGNLWIGTLGGLSKYDGKNFTNYTVRNGLHNNIVVALATDSAGNIYIAGPSGLSVFNGRNFRFFPLAKHSDGPIITSQQVQVVNDTIWWRVRDELFTIVKDKMEPVPLPGRSALTAILAMRANIYIAKDSAIYVGHNNRWDTVFFKMKKGDHSPTVTRLFSDKDGHLWVATRAGLYHIDSGRVAPYTHGGKPLPYQPVIWSVAQDNFGSLWLGSNTGVLKLHDGQMEVYNKRNGLSDNSIYSVLNDAEGNIWMASDGQGIFRFSGTQFTGLDETMGLPGAQVMAIASNRRDSLYIGTYDAGLFVFSNGKVSPLAFPNAPVPVITSMIYSREHKLWIGTRNRGLWSYYKSTYYQFEAPNRGFPSNNITNLYEDTAHRLWIGFDKGAIVHEGEKYTFVDTKNSEVFSFLTIGRDSTLIATQRGLIMRFADLNFDFKTKTIVDSSSINCMLKQGHYLWFGTSDNGLIRYDMSNGKVLEIDKSRGLHSDFIYNIIADNDSNIWVGTGFGIHKIRVPEDGGAPEIKFYGRSQGIRGVESNLNAVIKLPDGSIWFGTTSGAIHYQPHTAEITSLPPSMVLLSVKLPGESAIERSWYDSTDNWYGIPYGLHLPYKKNTVSFSFQAISMAGAEQVLYRYKMDGLDAPWSEWSNTNTVTYSALPPGNYILRAQCITSSGQQSQELAYKFEIITPFQKTRWFKLVVLGFCILAGILLQYVFSRRKRRRYNLRAKLRAEEQSKIRLRTAEDFHDEIGNKLTRINVLANVLKSKINYNPDALRIISQIEENTGMLYGGTRDILWSLKPSNDNLFEILLRIRDFGGELFQDTNINFNLHGIEEKWRKVTLPMDMSRNLIMIFKEALNNVLKYADAKNVTMEVAMKGRSTMQIVLKDDGKGFDTRVITQGNGINNMQVRATRLHGRLYIDSRPGKGTVITLTIKIPRIRG